MGLARLLLPRVVGQRMGLARLLLPKRWLLRVRTLLRLLVLLRRSAGLLPLVTQCNTAWQTVPAS